ncbi:MAG: cytochrome c oxidase subunit 3 [Rhodospirillales bacterium]
MTGRAPVHEPFQRADQQREAAMLGMAVFLASEVMLFGGLFAAALAIRFLHPDAVVAASRALHVWIGAANTAILLTSSLAVALAVEAAREGSGRRAAAALAAAAGLGVAFLCLKAFEYYSEYAEGMLPLPGTSASFASPAHRLFMDLYLIATSLHAVHVGIGVMLLTVVAVRIAGGALALPGRAVVVETGGLYWHLVDIVWVFLYPLLYLAR